MKYGLVLIDLLAIGDNESNSSIKCIVVDDLHEFREVPRVPITSALKDRIKSEEERRKEKRIR